VPTKIVGKGEFITHKSGKTMPAWYADAWKLPKNERAKLRSKTFPGIAKALATQYIAFANSGMSVPEWEDLFKGPDIQRSNAIIDKYVKFICAPA